VRGRGFSRADYATCRRLEPLRNLDFIAAEKAIPSAAEAENCRIVSARLKARAFKAASNKSYFNR